jgi:hypothetical protein
MPLKVKSAPVNRNCNYSYLQPAGFADGSSAASGLA